MNSEEQMPADWSRCVKEMVKSLKEVHAKELDKFWEHTPPQSRSRKNYCDVVIINEIGEIVFDGRRRHDAGRLILQLTAPFRAGYVMGELAVYVMGTSELDELFQSINNVVGSKSIASQLNASDAQNSKDLVGKSLYWQLTAIAMTRNIVFSVKSGHGTVPVESTWKVAAKMIKEGAASILSSASSKFCDQATENIKALVPQLASDLGYAQDRIEELFKTTAAIGNDVVELKKAKKKHSSEIKDLQQGVERFKKQTSASHRNLETRLTKENALMKGSIATLRRERQDERERVAELEAAFKKDISALQNKLKRCGKWIGELVKKEKATTKKLMFSTKRMDALQADLLNLAAQIQTAKTTFENLSASVLSHQEALAEIQVTLDMLQTSKADMENIDAQLSGMHGLLRGELQAVEQRFQRGQDVQLVDIHRVDAVVTAIGTKMDQEMDKKILETLRWTQRTFNCETEKRTNEMKELRIQMMGEFKQSAAGLSRGSLKRQAELKELIKTLLTGEAALRRSAVTQTHVKLEESKKQLEDFCTAKDRKVMEEDVLKALTEPVSEVQTELMEILSQAETEYEETAGILDNSLFKSTKAIIAGLCESPSTVATDSVDDDDEDHVDEDSSETEFEEEEEADADAA